MADSQGGHAGLVQERRMGRAVVRAHEHEETLLRLSLA
uniref:Uncharacterized protein n=1 Tax=Arundo donax TaxID=35708 RepID=A0A0A9HC82_ARUDO